MKFIARIDRKTLKIDAFQYNEPGPLPPIIDPEDPEEAKDGGVPGPEEEKSKKPRPS